MIVNVIYGNLLNFPLTWVAIHLKLIIAWHKQSVRTYILIYTEMSSLINNALQQHTYFSEILLPGIEVIWKA